MKWPQCNVLALAASVLLSIPELILGDGNGSSSFSSALLSSAISASPPTSQPLFSTALRNHRMYDTSLQSSIIKLIRELMLTPKVYSMLNSNSQNNNNINANSIAERRADFGSGRVLFPGEARSASIIIADPVSRPTRMSGMRALPLTARSFDADGINESAKVPHSGRGISSSIITRGRPGKVERVPRPIIINGNSAALNAPRYNRMIDGPAPTVGGSGSATAVRIPQPSVITSQPLRILEGNRDSRGRSLKEIDVQGVRVIVGQRVPDDPEDKLFTWRNGRVIKGMFFPNDPSNSRPVNHDQSNDIISKPSSLVVSSAYHF